MSADEEFGRAVGDRLRQEVSDVHATAGLADTLRARKSRRAWTVRAAVGAPLVAAAAAAAVLFATAGNPVESPSGGDQAAPPVTSTTKAQVRNVAQVQQLTIKALRSVNDYVIYQKETSGSGYHEYWKDRATDRYRLDAHTTLPPAVSVDGEGDQEVRLPKPSEPPSGPLRLSRSIAGDGPLGDVHYIYVDHDQRTWHRYHDTEPPPENMEVPDVLDADALKKAIDEGRMTLIGTETVNGKETHHLRLFATFRGYQIDLWVDSASYLPVRKTSTVIDGPKKPVLTSDYEWLPKTPENLAKLELTPPPGYVEE